jgi:hypothetical protein
MSNSGFVIRAAGYADGTKSPYDGMFLAWFDPTADVGADVGGWTPDPTRAMTFGAADEAFVYWKSPLLNPDGTVMLRPDGKAERPLTAFNVSIEAKEPAVEHYIKGANALLSALYGKRHGRDGRSN